MKTHSSSAALPSARPLHPQVSHLRLLALGLVGGIALFATSPWLTRHWAQTADRVEQLCGRAQEPLAPLPRDTPARQLAGLNAR